jgi:ABC-type transport system involved in cytochrome c biogenesis ATPase subunit
MLRLTNVHAYYGKSHVLHGVNFDVGAGEIVALLGRNGSGRSTTVKTIMGLVDGTGSVRWREQEILGTKAFEIAHAGIGYVPENRDIFPKLTVHQNLMLGMKKANQAGRWSFDDMYKLFPRLKERQHTEAGVLSGGEQQMLTLCRTLMGDRRPGAEDRRTRRRVPARAQAPRHVGAAGRAEADHRPRSRRPLPGHGPRPDCFHRHAGRAARGCGRAQGVAGGLRPPGAVAT